MLPKVANLSTYGGPKFNYSAVTDPTRDEDAAHRNHAFADTAAMTHTAARSFFSFVGVNGATPTDPLSGHVHDSQWGNTAPVKPVLARTGEGVWTATYLTEVNTELTNLPTEQGGSPDPTPLNFRRALAQCQCSDGTLRHVIAEVTAANVVTIRGFLANGTADDLPGQIINVWIW